MTLIRPSMLSVLVLLTLGATACSRGQSPTSVAERFSEALATGDFATARANATPQTANIIDTVVSKSGPDAFKADTRRKPHDEVISGDTALVSFRNDDGSIATVPLVKLDGAWKVDFSALVENAAGGHARVPNPVSE